MKTYSYDYLFDADFNRGKNLRTIDLATIIRWAEMEDEQVDNIKDAIR